MIFLSHFIPLVSIPRWKLIKFTLTNGATFCRWERMPKD